MDVHVQKIVGFDAYKQVDFNGFVVSREIMASTIVVRTIEHARKNKPNQASNYYDTVGIGLINL